MQAYPVVIFDMSNAANKELQHVLCEMSFVKKFNFDKERNFTQIFIDKRDYTEANISHVENVIVEHGGDRVVEDIEFWVTDSNNCAILQLI